MSVDTVKLWDDAYSYTMALCLFVVTLTLFRPMIFSQTLAQLSCVLQTSARSIFEFSFIYLVFLISFGTSVVIGLGVVYEEFCNIGSAMATEFAMTLIGFKEFGSGNTDDVAFSRTVLVLFHLCSQIVFMNLFISFMYLQLSTVRRSKDMTEKSKELSEHMWKKLAVLFGKRQVIPDGPNKTPN